MQVPESDFKKRNGLCISSTENIFDMQMKQIIGLMLAGGAAVAVYKLYNMPKEKRSEMLESLKKETLSFLEKAESSVDKVQHYMGQIREKNPDEWLDKAFIVKNMLSDFYRGKPEKQGAANGVV